MLLKIRDHFLEFIIIGIILTGVLYSSTTSYKTSLVVHEMSKNVEENKKKIIKISQNILKNKLIKGTLKSEDIEILGKVPNDGIDISKPQLFQVIGSDKPILKDHTPTKKNQIATLKAKQKTEKEKLILGIITTTTEEYTASLEKLRTSLERVRNSREEFEKGNNSRLVDKAINSRVVFYDRENSIEPQIISFGRPGANKIITRSRKVKGQNGKTHEKTTSSNVASIKKRPFHIVKEGETLSKISKDHKIKLSRLMKYNNISRNDINKIGVGDKLYIPNFTKSNNKCVTKACLDRKTALRKLKAWSDKSKYYSTDNLREKIQYK